MLRRDNFEGVISSKWNKKGFLIGATVKMQLLLPMDQPM